MFQKAKPIWIKNKEREMNVQAVFCAEVHMCPEAKLYITGSAFYRIFVNDKFVGFGPARTARGYARQDIFSLRDFIAEDTGKCKIVIEAVGYFCHSISTVFQPSFIMAEVQSEGEVIAYTGRDFKGFLPGSKVQKVERYSVQRHFCEVWDYRNGYKRTEESCSADIVILPEIPHVLDRRAPYPLYEDVDLKGVQCQGVLSFDETLPYKALRYSWAEIPEWWGRFDWDEITYHPYSWVQRQKQTVTGGSTEFPIVLRKGEYVILDFGRVEAGFLKASMTALEESDVVIGFNEYYEGTQFVFPNMNVHNVVEYLLPEGDAGELQSFEPYTYRFVMLAVKEGSIQLNSFGTKTFMFDTRGVQELNSTNEELNAIYRAAVCTFAHNAVDLYSDCPSRERAGWLCDSYFTAKTEYALTGETKVEDAFLENYRLFDNCDNYPQGILPMCYPSDKTPAEQFIPQWTMWYILEVEEYVFERGHLDMLEDFRESVYGLLAFYRQYENEDGLLECLPSWNFVEWSDANLWTQDVNYPTNFLYAQVLESVAHLYDDVECRRRSEEVRRVAVEQSFNGSYFMDHAVRDEEGRLQLQEHSSEACQYYAVLFAGIDIHAEEYKVLKHLIQSVFGPERETMPEIFPVNAFIGAYLRLETLLKMKEPQLLLADIVGFFGAMEAKTGTLWEYRQHQGSYDHGFASYSLVAIQKALEMKS